MKKVTLILGSGGARGYAHIGVIKELTSRGYQINSIVGSSIGAIIGAIYASGELKKFEDWVTELDILNTIKFLDFSFLNSGIIKGNKIFTYIDENFLHKKNIEELNIPFIAVATDIINQREVWFQNGKTIDALRASSAIPSVFVPYKINKKLYVDGGILNPVPILPIGLDKSDIIITVNLSGKENRSLTKRKRKKDSSLNIYNKAQEKIYQFFKKDKNSLNTLKVMTKSLDIMQNALSQYKMAAYNSDISINIPYNSAEFYEFHRAKDLIAIGREMAKNAIDEFEKS